MQRGFDYKQYAVLFVDDEDMARKYFALGLQADLRVLTAPSVDDALVIIEREGDTIGVVVTDQRMPGKLGVDLLAQVRKTHPDIVRLLTTAYSDLDDAIAAVNSGEIFRYLSKPWNPQVLRAEITNAMTFFLMRNERNLLLQEKMNVWQRLIQTNRIRDLAVLTGGMTHLRNPLHALQALLDQWANSSHESVDTDWHSVDHWGLIQAEIARMSVTSRHVATAIPTAEVILGFTEPLNLQELLSGVHIVTPGESVPTVTVNAPLLRRWFNLLIGELGGPDGDISAEINTGAEGIVCVTLSGTTSRSPGAALHAPTVDNKSAEILGTWFAAYLIAFHHSGNMTVESSDRNLRVTLFLPANPTTATLPALGDDWLEDIFTRYEGW